MEWLPRDCPSITRLLQWEAVPSPPAGPWLRFPGGCFCLRGVFAGRKEKVVTDSFVGECPREQPMRGTESPAQTRGAGVTASIRHPREETARLGKEK